MQFIIKITNSVIQRLPYRLRFALVFLIYLATSILLMLQPYMQFGRLGYWIVFVFLVTSFLGGKEPIDWDPGNIRKTPFLLIALWGIIVIVNGVAHISTGQILQGLCFLFFAPAVWVVLLNKNNQKSIITAASWGIVLSLYFLLAASVLYSPLYPKQYSSILLNPNGLSQVIIPIFACTLYLIENELDKDYVSRIQQVIKLVFLLLSLGLSSSFILLSKSRTGLLCCVGMIILWIVYRIFVIKNIRIVLLSFVVMYLAFHLVVFLLLNVSYSIMNQEIREKGSAKRFVGLEIYTYNKLSEFKSSEPEESRNHFEQLFDRLDKGIEEQEDFSSGRFIIWKTVFNLIGLKGRPEGSTFTVAYSGVTRNINNPHNIFLSIGYFFGYPAMAVMFVFIMELVVMLFVRTIRSLKKRTFRKLDVFILLICSSFFVVSIISGTYFITSSMHALLFWQLVPCQSIGRFSKYQTGGDVS